MFDKLEVCGLVAGFVFVSLISLHAQPKAIRFEHITSDQGLSQNAVVCIYQDSRGYLWLGTFDGLNRYDGYTFTIFKNNPADSNSLSNNVIRKIVEDYEGNLWLATTDGLNKLNKRTEKFTIYKYQQGSSNCVSSNDIQTLLVTRDSSLWVGTRNAGLNRFDPRTQRFLQYTAHPDNPNSFRAKSVFALFQARSDRVWIGTSDGLFEYAGDSSFQFYQIPSTKPNDCVIVSISEDKNGVLWLATLTGGVVRFNLQDSTFTRYDHNQDDPASISASRVWTAHEDNTGALWIATADGLNVLDRTTGTFKIYKHNPDKINSISNNHVLSICEDRSGVLWFGTLNGGLNKYNPQTAKFPHITHLSEEKNSLSNNSVWAFHEDREGFLWIGTEGGLNRFDSKSESLKIFRHNVQDPASLSSDVVVSLAEDGRGNLWIGTRNGGLNILDRRSMTFRHFVHIPGDSTSISNNGVISSMEDRDGNMWFGADGGGLNRLQFFSSSQARFKVYRHEPKDTQSLSSDIVGSIAEDRSGALWIGTFGGGLNRFDNTTEKFRRYLSDPKNERSLSNSIITCIYIEPSGMFWVGTASGLNHFDPMTGIATRFTVAHGLINDFIYGILPDDQQNLWLSTNKGIIKFSIRNLGEQEDGVSLSKRFTNYDVNDGLQGDEFNSGAYFKSKNGEMFFGGANGFNRFFPGRIHNNTSIPPVVLTSFRRLNSLETFGKPLSALGHIALLYTDYFFSFEVAALDFSDPNSNQFQYMMEGFDKNWIPTGTRRFMTYTNLDPGNYIFRVKGSNNDGVWNDIGLSIPLTIQPPYWRTWWFYTVIVITLSLIAYGAYRYRVNQLLAMERLRVRLASDLHDELATNLSSISMFGEILQQSREVDEAAKSQLLERMTTLARESVGSIREIIWTIDPKPEKLYNLLMRFNDMIIASCRAKNITLQFETSPKEDFGGITLNPEVRKELWLILKEASANAIKHSGGTTLRIFSTYQARNVRVNITDNGYGFDTTGSFKGKGLGTMRMRAKRLGGSFDIESRAGAGTTVTLTTRV